MAEVLVSFGSRIQGPDGRSYTVQVSGREREDRLWEGWLEFLPLDGSAPVVTARETTQPNRKDLLYWASGLTDPYMDGALLRTLRQPPKRAPTAPASPVAAAPADYAVAGPTTHRTRPVAVLDPFHVHAEGVEVLWAQLRALSADQLRNIIAAYELADDISAGGLDGLDRNGLAALILRGVERRLRT